MLHSASSADDGVVLNRRGESRVLCELPKTKPDVLYISNFLNHQQSLRCQKSVHGPTGLVMEPRRSSVRQKQFGPCPRAPRWRSRRARTRRRRMTTHGWVVASFWQKFGKMLLVFGCIGTDFCKNICVLQHFSKSTRLSSCNF